MVSVMDFGSSSPGSRLGLGNWVTLTVPLSTQCINGHTNKAARLIKSCLICKLIK